MVLHHIKRHAVGYLALMVTLGGTAYAAKPAGKLQTTVRGVSLPPVGENGTSSAVVKCVKGERVTGGGYKFGPVDISNVSITHNHPDAKTGWKVEIQTVDAAKFVGTISAYAVCAKR